ncbi:MAG: hypothetical protein WAL25_12235, partial [Acidimicrobiia bacterium]
LATMVHVGVLSVHDYLPFSWREILVPGASTWRPIAVALGTVGLYGLAMVTSSFYVRRWIGQRAWRYIHFGSFGVFVASLLHGIQAGTDSGSPLMLGVYAGAAIVVFTLTAQRMLTMRASRPLPPSPSAATGNFGQGTPARPASTAAVSRARSGSE